MPEDVYDDPDNILAGDEDATEHERPWHQDMSETPYLPERDLTNGRGRMDEVDPDIIWNEDDEDVTHPEDMDPDANKLGDVNPADEQDSTEA